MRIAQRMDKLPGPQPARLGHHHRQQRIGGDVERHAEKRVGTPLIQLARQPPPGHVELEQHMARRQGHLLDLRDVPRRDQDPPRLGIRADQLLGPGDLVHHPAVGPRPRTPLVAVDMVQIPEAVSVDGRLLACRRQEGLAVERQHPVPYAKLIVVAEGVVVPDMYTILNQIFDIGVAPEEPQQFVDHPLQEDPLGGQQREARLQIEAHLVSEDPFGSGSGAVAAHDAFGHDPMQQIEVLFHDCKCFNVRSFLFPVAARDTSSPAPETHAEQRSGSGIQVFQRHLSPVVQHGIGGILLPSPEVHDMQRPVAEIAWEVHVPEDEMVDIVPGGILPGIFDQRFGQRGIESALRTLSPGLFVGRIVPFSGLSAPPVSELQRPVGVQAPREEPLQRPRAEPAVQQFQQRLSVDLHVVAVGHEDPSAVERQQLRRGVDLHAALAREVVADPHVVIPRKEDHADAAVGEFGEFAQRTYEPLGDHTPIFEPEVEDVADEKDRLRIAGRGIEPRHEPPFDLPGRSVATRPEVYVGREIDHHRVSSSSSRSNFSP